MFLGILFLILLLGMAAVIVVTTVRAKSSSGELITKKNLFFFAPTFLLLYLLYITASVFNGETIDFFYCFSLIGTTLDVVKFGAEESLLLPVCEAYPIFYADFVIAYLVGVVTVVLSVASFFSRRISNFISVKTLLRKNCDIVIGDSPDAVAYIKNTKNSLLLGTNVSGRRYADLLKEGVPVLKTPLEAKRISRMLKNRGYNFIVFRDGNHAYTNIIETFMQVYGKGKGAKIHFEANQQEMKILKEKFIPKADGNPDVYMTGFSKYELLARRFAVDYPITKYIPRSFYNPNFTLKDDAQINIVFIGFGKVNYQLFRMCAMQFQFAAEKDGKLCSKPVKYYIYDNNKTALHNEFFSRILYEFEEDFADCDFPKPEKICDLEIREEDVNSIEAKKQFKALVHKNSFTYFIVSLENDLEDASYAQTVKRLLRSDDNYRIFVRAKNNNGEKLNEETDRVIYFGKEKDLCTHENIVNDDLTELAQRINLLYNKISNPPEWLKELRETKDLSADGQRRILSENIGNAQSKEYMLSVWAKLPYIEQASNLYHAMNLPFKLNLLGFDMLKQNGENESGVIEAQFNEVYKNSGRENGYQDYSFFFGTEPGNVLAYIEHSRWNALYILYDYRQMKKADMKVEEKEGERSMSHKNTQLKQHACLTTYYGLNDLIAYKYEALYPAETFKEAVKENNAHLQELSKIYAYDYMDLDRLYGEITAMGYLLKPKQN